MEFTTQLGGLYRPENLAIFKVKQRLFALGVHVRHPMNDSFIQDDDQTFAFDPTMWSPHEVDMSYYESIAASDFHIVCNEPKGLVPVNTADAMLYAVLKDKPIILLHAPRYDPQIDAFSKKLLTAQGNLFHIYNLLKYDDAQLESLLSGIVGQKVMYNLTDAEATTIRKRVTTYLQSITDGAPTPEALPDSGQ